ncbi:CHASE2 domain-containing protein [Sneathiella chungangensis]|uniref:CHASE2 domain-containing protein n=1 Tax=Sneathiella chungangensis TaxID=1418234 RepID=A0A845MGM5_9PROT|nr:CHASE2 domain-containing protein [Sneathiella chungangensis]MZR22407.1 CHASE2 domain-containing protein [Sneathiella chungangensis]
MSRPKRAFKVMPGPKLAQFLKLLFAIVMSVILVLITPEAIEKPTDELSYGYFTRLLGSRFYPDSEVAKKSTFVVIINQKSLNEDNLTWPPPFEFHSDVIRRILKAEPAAVVLDFLLVDRRQDKSLDDLVATFSYAKNDLNIPIIVARGSFSAYGKTGIISDLEDHVTQAAGWSESGGHSAFRYALYPKDEENAAPSIAIEAFEAFCNNRKRDETAEAPASCDTRKNLEESAREMWVFWSSRVPDNSKVFQLDKGEPFEAVECTRAHLDDGPLDYIVDSILDLEPESSCPPQPWLPAHYFIKDPDNRIDEALKGRVVFYGFNLEGIQDTVKPPTTTNDIPGVFIHAMALENLIEWGSDYLSLTGSRANDYLPITADVLEVATLVVILLLYFLLAHYLTPYVQIFLDKKYKKVKYEYETTNNPFVHIKHVFLFLLAFYKNHSGRRIWLRWVKIALILLLEVLLLGAVLLGVSLYVEMGFFRIAPVNWMAILAIVGVVQFLSLRR